MNMNDLVKSLLKTTSSAGEPNPNLDYLGHSWFRKKPSCCDYSSPRLICSCDYGICFYHVCQVQHSHTQNVHAVAGSYGTGNSWFSNFIDLASTSQEHCNKKGYVQFIPSLGHNWSVASPLQLWTIRNYVFLVLQKKNCHLNEHSNVIYVLQKLELCSILEAFLELVKQIHCSLNDGFVVEKKIRDITWLQCPLLLKLWGASFHGKFSVYCSLLQLFHHAPSKQLQVDCLSSSLNKLANSIPK